MEKAAQLLDFPFLAEVFEDKPKETELIISVPDEKKEENKEYVFKLEEVPGADPETVEVLEDEPEEVEEEEEKIVEPVDEWDWRPFIANGKFLDWVQDRFKNIPKHNGQQLTGIDRAISYCERLMSEVRRAAKTDYKKQIDIQKAEEALSELHSAIKRLRERGERLETKKFKKSKKSSETFNMIKTADTTTTGNIIITVPYLISNVARACIDATVSAGADMEQAFEKLASEYKLDKREKSQVMQLIKDMGYPIILDRLNPFKPLTPTTTDIKEYNQQFYA